MLFSLFLVVVQLTPDKPNFPSDFLSNLVSRSRVSNISITAEGLIAQNLEKELALTEHIFPKLLTEPNGCKVTNLYNKKSYKIIDSFDGTPPNCTCEDVSFTDDGLPFFSQMIDFKYIGENESMVWWEFNYKEDLTSSPFVFYVENTPPGTLSIPVEIDIIGGNPTIYLSTSFPGFQTASLNDHFYDVPEVCRNITCKGTELDPISPFKSGILFPPIKF